MVPVPPNSRNAGVRVISAPIDPEILLARNENRLAGETALDLVENPYLARYGNLVPVSGMLLPRAGRYYVSVETRPGSKPGPYVLRFWANDATPPRVRLVTPALYGTEAVLHAMVTDSQSGFDPASLDVSVDGHPVDSSRACGATTSPSASASSRRGAKVCASRSPTTRSSRTRRTRTRARSRTRAWCTRPCSVK